MVTRKLISISLAELAGLGTLAFLFYYLHMSDAPAQSDVWSVDRVVCYTLMLAASLFIFVPASMALKLGPLWLLGSGTWSLLGYVLFFVKAPDRPETNFFTYVAFLTVIFVALGSALAIPLAIVGKRLLPGRSLSAEVQRAMRQGGLLALFLVAIMAMSPLGVLNWLNAILVLTTVALTEFIFLARD